MGVVGVGVVVVVILMDSRFNTTQDFLSFFFSFLLTPFSVVQIISLLVISLFFYIIFFFCIALKLLKITSRRS